MEGGCKASSPEIPPTKFLHLPAPNFGNLKFNPEKEGRHPLHLIGNPLVLDTAINFFFFRTAHSRHVRPSHHKVRRVCRPEQRCVLSINEPRILR